MEIKKILLQKDGSIKNNFVFVYKIIDNKILFKGFKKELKHEGEELPEFDKDSDALVFDYEHEENIKLIKVFIDEIDLSNIDLKLDTINSNILYAINNDNIVGLYNRDIETYNSKTGNEYTRNINNHAVLFNIYKQSPNKPVDQIIFHTHNDVDTFIEYDGEIEECLEYPLMPNIFINITGDEEILPDMVNEYDIELLDRAGEALIDNVDVYVKSNCGTISHTKISTIDGKGKLRVKADLLVPGDSIELKFGFKYFSNRHNKIIKVI